MHERPSWRAVLLAGLLTGYAITVWVPGVLIAIVFLSFLIVRRKGWRSLVAIVAGCAVPAMAYVLWFHSRTGDYELTDSGGFYLWGRVSSFAECSRIDPPADERMLCLSQPPSRREPPGDLIWHEPQVMAALPGGPVSAQGNALMESFAIRAVEAQPLSYVHVIIDGLVLAIEPVHHPYPSAGTIYDYYFHTKPQTVPDHSWIPVATAPQDIRAYGRASISRVVEPFAFAMAAYQRVVWLYGPLFGLIMILGLGGFTRVTRRDGWRISIQRRRDGPSMMPWVVAVVLLLGPGLAFSAPVIQPRRTDPRPSGAEAEGAQRGGGGRAKSSRSTWASPLARERDTFGSCPASIRPVICCGPRTSLTAGTSSRSASPLPRDCRPPISAASSAGHSARARTATCSLGGWNGPPLCSATPIARSPTSA